MEHIPEPGGKSLLLQTLALFETLLSKIQTLKTEAEVMSGENKRLGDLVKVKCDVEDDLRLSEVKLTSVTEVTRQIVNKMSRFFKQMGVVF